MFFVDAEIALKLVQSRQCRMSYTVPPLQDLAMSSLPCPRSLSQTLSTQSPPLSALRVPSACSDAVQSTCPCYRNVHDKRGASCYTTRISDSLHLPVCQVAAILPDLRPIHSCPSCCLVFFRCPASIRSLSSLPLELSTSEA